MPATHVALLRGINVGKAKRIAMADLRAVVTALGATDVQTLLNSGNVVFTARRAIASTTLQTAIRAGTGVDARTTVLTAAELSDDDEAPRTRRRLMADASMTCASVACVFSRVIRR